MIPSSCKYNGIINLHIGTRPCILCNGIAQMMRPTLPVVVSPSTRFVGSKYFMQFSFSSGYELMLCLGLTNLCTPTSMSIVDDVLCIDRNGDAH
jgi:hypothetical protein